LFPSSPSPGIRRRRFAITLAAGAAALSSPVLLAQGKPEKARLNLALGGKTSLYYMPLAVAAHLGFFHAEGLEINVTDFAGGSLALAALAAGSVDIAGGAYEHTIAQQGQGQPLQAFVMFGRTPQIVLGVSGRTMGGLRTLHELRGKRIGISAPGSSTQLLAALVLRGFGLTKGDVQYVGVGTGPSALNALRNREIDAISNVETVMTALQQKGEVRIVADTRSLSGTRTLFGGPMPGGCLYAPAEFVQKYPATCQALANGVVHALKWLRTAAPADIIQAVPESYLGGDRAMYLSAFANVSEAFSIDGTLAEDSARTALTAVSTLEGRLRAGRVDLAQTYNNEFARRARERFRV